MSAAGRLSSNWGGRCASSAPGVSKNSETGKAIDYSLKRWSALTRFLDDGGRLCMSNNAAERELRAKLGAFNKGVDRGGALAAASEHADQRYFTADPKRP